MPHLRHLFALLIALAALTGCQDKPEAVDTPAPFAERYKAAQERERALFDSGVTAQMVEGTQNVTKEFFPEAAERIASASQVPINEAEALLRKEMKRAADRVEKEYVEEFGYGSIVRTLRAAEEQSVVVDAIESSGEELKELYGSHTKN